MIGPIYKTIERRWAGNPSYIQSELRKSVYKTSPGDKRVPLPYSSQAYHFEQVFRSVVPPSADYPAARSVHEGTKWVLSGHPLDALAQNRARSDFIEKMKGAQSAALGTTIAEGNEALGMIVNRVRTLGSAYDAVKRGKFATARRLLRVTNPEYAAAQAKAARERRKRDLPGKASDAWLEYWFGWAPLMGDIYQAMTILESLGTAPNRVTGRGRINVPYTYFYDTGDTRQWYSGTYRMRYQIRGNTRMVNPNLALAESLGIVNPATVLFEVIPLSFFLGWMVNVSDFLNSYTDTLGWDISDVCVSRKWYLTNGKYDYWSRTSSAAPWRINILRQYASWFIRSVGFPGLPNVSLVWSQLNGLSLTRAASSVALIVKKFFS